jgi:plasmid stability protein
VKDRLQKRAARHGRSMEAEVRDILRDVVKEDERPSGGLGTEIAALFNGLGLEASEEFPPLTGLRLQNPIPE